MNENLIDFIIWFAVGVLIIIIGISSLFSKKTVGFWANIKVEKVKDVKKYNLALGKLFITYGVIFTLLGLPILNDQNKLLILFSILGVMLETILTMVIYTLVISKKYIDNGKNE